MATTLQQLQQEIGNAFDLASQQETMSAARSKMAEGIAQAISNFVVGRTVTGTAPDGGGSITAQVAGDNNGLSY